MPSTKTTVKLTIVLLLLQSFAAFADKADKPLVLASGEWPPFLSQKLPHGGFAAHIVTVVFKRMGYDVSYRFYPWARAEHMVKQGQVTGSVVWSRTHERATFAWFSEPVITIDAVVFHLKSRPFDWQNANDFSGKIIGLPLGSATQFWQPMLAQGTIRLERVVDIETGFRRLLKGRLDLMAVGKDVGYFVLKNRFDATQLQRVTHSAKVLKSIDYRLMLSKTTEGSQSLLTQFNTILLSLRRSGELKRMKEAFEHGL